MRSRFVTASFVMESLIDSSMGCTPRPVILHKEVPFYLLLGWPSYDRPGATSHA